MKLHCPQAPVIFVGNKVGRGSQKRIVELKRNGQFLFSYEEGVRPVNEIGTKAYVECSAKTGEGVTKVFTEALKAQFKEELKNKSTFFGSFYCTRSDEAFHKAQNNPIQSQRI